MAREVYRLVVTNELNLQESMLDWKEAGGVLLMSVSFTKVECI